MESPKDTVWIINPDLLAKRITEEENLPQDDANLQAVIRIESWLYSSVDAYQSVGVETVLSSSKYRQLITAAKAKGFFIHLVYVYLRTIELNIERVRLRVEKGGHSVPEDKIRERRERSFDQLGWFFDNADFVDIIDNSESVPKRILYKKPDEPFIFNGMLIPEIAKSLLRTHPDWKGVL